MSGCWRRSSGAGQYNVFCCRVTGCSVVGHLFTYRITVPFFVSGWVVAGGGVWRLGILESGSGWFRRKLLRRIKVSSAEITKLCDSGWNTNWVTDHSHSPTVRRQSYTQRHIKIDQPGLHDFLRFLRQFWKKILDMLQKPFSIQILSAVKKSQNDI